MKEVARSMTEPGALRIGLLNNGSARTGASTARRFRDACTRTGATFSFAAFSMERIEGHEPAGRLFDAGLDALVVTGMEPSAPRLDQERVWPLLTRVVDWAVGSRLPVIWSCLAAHACALHLDAVDRRPLPSKLSGLHRCSLTDASDVHAAGLPTSWLAPHSRLNDLPPHVLEDAGYRILSRLDDGGADMFVRPGLKFLFMQGHPEYDGRSLLLEYRRDIRRFLTGESGSQPSVPCACVDAASQSVLERRARAAPRAVGDAAFLSEVLDEIDRIETPACGWREVADTVFGNWLAGAAPPAGLRGAARLAVAAR